MQKQIDLEDGCWEGNIIEKGKTISFKMYFFLTETTLKGIGEDDRKNIFLVDGQYNSLNEKVVWTTYYLTKEQKVQFTGMLADNKLWGFWAHDQSLGEFHLKRCSDQPGFAPATLIETIQSWEGHYEQMGRDYPMKASLLFSIGVIEGKGEDDLGPFTILGRYGSQDSPVYWVKSYIGKHQVIYTGRWDGEKIHGLWTIFPSTGTFELEPVLKS